MSNVFFIGISILYFITSTFYVIIGRNYLKCLKTYCPKQARDIRKRIIFSVCCISGPLYMRATENMIRYFFLHEVTFIQKSLAENTIWYPIFIIIFYLTNDFLPISAMMGGLRIVINHYYQSLKDDPLVEPTNSPDSPSKMLNDSPTLGKQSTEINDTILSSFREKHKQSEYFRYNEETDRNDTLISFKDLGDR